MPPEDGDVEHFPETSGPTRVGWELEECSHFSQGATAIWGPEWSTQNIEVKCDNAAVIAVCT